MIRHLIGRVFASNGTTLKTTARFAAKKAEAALEVPEQTAEAAVVDEVALDGVEAAPAEGAAVEDTGVVDTAQSEVVDQVEP